MSAENIEKHPSTYVYILAAYLGDGSISRMPRTYRLRVTLDSEYPGIITEVASGLQILFPKNKVSIIPRRHAEAVDVTMYSKLLPVYFPQHGPGVKHKRSLRLESWQQNAMELFPREFIRGLIHTDGSRYIQTVKSLTKSGKKLYKYPRYSFKNESQDLRDMFREACGLLNVSCSPAKDRGKPQVFVSRRQDVAFFDTFVGPKK